MRIKVRGVALDSKGNFWTASNMSLDFPPPVIPDGVSIMEQFKIAAARLLKALGNPKMTTGVVNMITGCLFMETTYTIEFMRLAEPPLRRSSIHRPFMSPIIVTWSHV